MESAKLKNIILLILLITNALLLGLMVVQRVEAHQHRQQALSDAVELLEQRGISVDLADIPDSDFPQSMTLARDADQELEQFTDLLGQGTALTQRGLVSLYTGPLGTAEVRVDGGFSVTLSQDAYPMAPNQDLANHAQDLARQLGFSTALTGQETTAEGEVLTLVQHCGGYPVFSCTLQVWYKAGQLLSIHGTRLVGRPAADPSQGQSLSMATLLVRFRSGIIDSGDACTAIRSASQGYVLSADVSGILRLTPVLRLETDTNPYIVNALTGALTRG